MSFQLRTFLACSLSFITGCGALTLDPSGSVDQSISGATVTTDASTYNASDPVIVSYTGLPGTSTDWIGIVPEGGADSAYVAWTYTDGSSASSVTFNNLPPGTYTARAFEQDSWTKDGESAAFSITLSGASLTTTKPTFADNESIVVDFSGMSTNPHDWITVVPAGSSPSTYQEWHYTDGQASGELTFAPLPSGSYEVRAFYNDSLVSAATTEFTVAGTASMASDQAAYSVGVDVGITYDHFPGNQYDWIGIYPTGASDSEFIRWTYTFGANSGVATFTDLPAGTYTARAFEDNGLTKIVESAPFTVGGATLSTTQASYAVDAPITVNFSALSTSPTDWITIVPANAAPDAYGEWHYTGGQTSGQMTFAGLAAGAYEVRAFYNDGLQLAAKASFSVGSLTVGTDKASYSASDTIHVSFSGAPGNAHDWVGISPVGAPDDVYVSWAYTNGQSSGSLDFSALAPGDYEARLYLNDTFTVLGSATFTVAASATVEPDAATYTTADTVNVTFSGLPGNAHDWIAIAATDAPNDVFVAWAYTDGAKSGTAQFANLPAGTYEVRAFVNDSVVLAGRSASTFTVTAL